MSRLVDTILTHPSLGRMVVHRRELEATGAEWAEPAEPFPAPLAEALRARGLDRLWSHQAAGLDRVREGADVLIVTPTASGKTLLFGSTVIETCLREPGSRALLLYPTKALARDQLAALRDLAGGTSALRPPRFEIYDGDTPASRRKAIRADPPDALITNPDMLHLGILAHHAEWSAFLRDLRWIVLDELHVYRGLFGAHVHHILARLQRLCARLGARPRFVAASATVGNPGEFARTLTGREFAVIDRSGAPRSSRDVVFLNPVGVSPYTVALRVIAEAVRGGERTIAFTKARRVAELLHIWLARQEPELARRVAPYRAGYLPEERRRLERRLFDGDLSAVLSTSALELGIDVGGLDVCVLVGYPGSLISTWQRIGRVGRQRREGTVVLVALPDALDQYVVKHPELFFGGQYEPAVLDPANPLVAGQHLVCAAAEEPLGAAELVAWHAAGPQLAADLERDGRLVLDRDGSRWFSFRRRPHRDVSVRSAGEPWSIVDTRSSRLLGRIDGQRVWYECHPGAVYLHGGRSFLVHGLDRERRQVAAEPTAVDYYTVVLGEKETEILDRLERRELGPFSVGLGRLKVTVRIREYQKKRLFDAEAVSNHPLDVPPLVFETVGFWIELPPALPAAFAARGLHFMGGIHAAEHATIGLFPLLAIADRDDVGGISYTGHPQLGAPAIFVYDGVPGGAGLAARGFRDLEALVARTLELVEGCPCDDGCPGCIQSPKCGNGNKPLDKVAALLVLALLAGREDLQELIASVAVEPAATDVLPNTAPAGLPTPEQPERRPGFFEAPRAAVPARRHGIRRAGNVDPAPPAVERTLVFDLETQRSAEEVGGWGHSDRMGLALAVVWDVQRGAYRTYYESDIQSLLLDLAMADRVVGFNIERFDLKVLSAYSEWDLSRIRTLDLLSDIHGRIGFRLSLAHLAEVNLGESKSADGLQSLVWWKQGRLDLIETYCRQDVDLTRRIWELGRQRGYLLYRDRAQREMRLPVEW